MSAYGGADDMDRAYYDWWESIGKALAKDFKKYGGVDSSWSHQQVGMHIVKLLDECKAHPNQDILKSLRQVLK